MELCQQRTNPRVVHHDVGLIDLAAVIATTSFPYPFVAAFSISRADYDGQGQIR
jgi:hypothetical protein